MSCKKMIPLYPVRYAVKGTKGKPTYSSQGTLENKFPALKEASYTLHTIPAEHYILIVESFSGGTAFRLFQNSIARKGFIEVDWEKYSKGAAPVHKGVAKSYIPINHQVTSLHIGLSEYPITPRMANKLVGSHKTKVMLQEIPVGSWAKTSPSKHTFHVDKLKDVLEEFSNEGNILYHEKLPTFKTDVPRQVAGDMKIEYTPEQLDDPKKDKRMVVALHDPVGITEDLNAFLGIQMQRMQEYVNKEGHRYTSGKLVSDYIKSVVPNQADIEKRTATAEAKARKTAGHGARGIRNKAKRTNAKMFEPLESAYEVLKGGKGTIESIVQHRTKYDAKIKSFEPQILASASDALIWAKQIHNGGVVEKHLAIHDHECTASWQYYERQVSNCINSLVNSAKGEAFVFDLIQSKPDDSPLWKALAKGDKNLWADLLSSKTLADTNDLVSKLSEYGAQDETALLSGLLKPFLTKNAGSVSLYMARLSAVLQHRTGYKFIQYSVSRSAIYNLAVDYIHDGKNLTGVNAKIHKQTISKLLRKTTTVTATQTVPLYTLEKVGEINLKKYTPLKAPSLGKDNPFRKFAEGRIMGQVGNVITIAGAISSGVTLEKAIIALVTGKPTKDEAVVFLSASSSFASASVSFAGMVDTINKTHKGYDKALIKVAQKGFIKWAGIFGAVASAFTAVSDGMKANQLMKLGESEAAGSRIASSAFNGATAIATGLATYTAITGTALLLGPVGWFVLAVVLAGAAIYYATKSDKARLTPVQFWLKRSPWGLAPRLDSKEETEVFYKVFFKPQVSADWDDEFGADILTIRFYLPQYQAGKSVFEWKDATTAKLGGENLNPVLYEYGQAYMSAPYDEVNWGKDFHIYEQVEAGKGYAVVVVSIHVNDSAKVNFAYNYYPYGVDSKIILTHDKAGMNWEFKDDVIFWNDTINENKLEILSDQDRLEYIK